MRECACIQRQRRVAEAWSCRLTSTLYTRVAFFTFHFLSIHRLQLVIHNSINPLLSFHFSLSLSFFGCWCRVAKKVYADRVPGMVVDRRQWQNHFGSHTTWSIEEIKNIAANMSAGRTICRNNVSTFLAHFPFATTQNTINNKMSWLEHVYCVCVWPRSIMFRRYTGILCILYTHSLHRLIDNVR